MKEIEWEKNKTRIMQEILNTYGHSPACLEAKERPKDKVDEIMCTCHFDYYFQLFKDGYEAGRKSLPLSSKT